MTAYYVPVTLIVKLTGNKLSNGNFIASLMRRRMGQGDTRKETLIFGDAADYDNNVCNLFVNGAALSAASLVQRTNKTTKETERGRR